MRFFEQKKTLKPDDLSVLKSVETLLAEWTGLEPATPCVTGTYSNQLNYHSGCSKLPLNGLQIYAAFFITQTVFSKSYLALLLSLFLVENVVEFIWLIFITPVC
jgi:hypothetical protein